MYNLNNPAANSRECLEEMIETLELTTDKLHYRAQVDLIKIVRGILDRLDTYDETIKKANDDMEVLRGFRPKKKQGVK